MDLDEVLQAFDPVVGECHGAVVFIDAINPDQSIFRSHFDGDIVEPAWTCTGFAPVTDLHHATHYKDFAMPDVRVSIALAYEDRRFAAMAASDLDELKAVLADDLHYVHANGMIEDKAEFLRKISSRERNYQAVRLISRTVSAQPGFVATFGRIEVEVMRASGLLVKALDYTAIYRDHDPRLFA